MTRKIDKTFVEKSLLESTEVIKQTARDSSVLILKAATQITKTFKNNKKLLFCGNGGSASQSQHLAAELVGRFKKERPALAAISLTTDTSILTAVANDYHSDFIFSRQVEALGQKGDLLFCFSTSGNSTNVIKAVEKAKTMKLFTIGLLGNDGGKVKNKLDLAIIVNHNTSDKIQEAHLAIGHVLCDIVEQRLF